MNGSSCSCKLCSDNDAFFDLVAVLSFAHNETRHDILNRMVSLYEASKNLEVDK